MKSDGNRRGPISQIFQLKTANIVLALISVSLGVVLVFDSTSVLYELFCIAWTTMNLVFYCLNHKRMIAFLKLRKFLVYFLFGAMVFTDFFSFLFMYKSNTTNQLVDMQ